MDSSKRKALVMVKISFKQVEQSNLNVNFITAFIDACKSIDVLSLETLLEDDIVVNNQSKWEFLSHVRDSFNRMKMLGNKTLGLHMHKCMICAPCRYKDVHYFKGINKADWIAFVILMEGEQLKDIVICNASIDPSDPAFSEWSFKS